MDTKNFMDGLEFLPHLGVAKAEEFSKLYPIMNKYIIDNLSVQDSRAGRTKEMLDFKTQLTNPYNRCVGGFGRDINIFFLLAEAMWIANGRKDVKFLTLFNAKMSDFSDDGEVFHAPYGFRLRHWGVRSEDKFIEDNMSASQGQDQVADVLRILSENPDNRQVVMSIWNPDLDLGAKTKDTPCNDMVMLKIRNGKLITTIQNRSNDLHWGLPTNIFQFSFMSEVISNCLGIEMGTQTHNSQSLHIYEWNETADKMKHNFEDRLWSEADSINDSHPELYEVSKSRKMVFNFEHEVSGNRLREVDMNLNLIIECLEKLSKDILPFADDLKQIQSFSPYLYTAYNLCAIYLLYKKEIAAYPEQKDELRHKAISRIESFCYFNDYGNMDSWDIIVLAKNFFASRISNFEHPYLGTL